MKKWTLKARLVLLHTVMMTCIVALMLALLFSISSSEILSNVEQALEDRVAGAFEDISWDGDRLDVDSDLMSLENGVYLSVYEEESGELLYGRIPYGFLYDLPFSYGSVRTVAAGDENYCVLDEAAVLPPDHAIVVRGVVSTSNAEREVRYALTIALILLPLLVILTALCGYLLSRRALAPVAHITKTVQNIRREKDLSKRIALGPGRDEIYKLADTFDSLFDAVEKSVKREKQFTSDVAHELRTPLSVVLMQCEDLLADSTLSGEQRREVEVIRRKTSSMSRMISQLLLLSRADQGRAKLELEQVDVSELCAMLAEEYADVAAPRRITVQAEIEPGLSMQADQMLLIRLLGNLLQNAVHYGKDGGHILLSAAREGDSLRISVKDDGIGIAAQDLPHIWERFYQADPSRHSENSGLGLSMAKWIIEAHGGAISAESVPGEGSVFTCIFPL